MHMHVVDLDDVILLKMMHRSLTHVVHRGLPVNTRAALSFVVLSDPAWAFVAINVGLPCVASVHTMTTFDRVRIVMRVRVQR